MPTRVYASEMRLLTSLIQQPASLNRNSSQRIKANQFAPTHIHMHMRAFTDLQEHATVRRAPRLLHGHCHHCHHHLMHHPQASPRSLLYRLCCQKQSTCRIAHVCPHTHTHTHTHTAHTRTRTRTQHTAHAHAHAHRQVFEMIRSRKTEAAVCSSSETATPSYGRG